MTGGGAAAAAGRRCRRWGPLSLRLTRSAAPTRRGESPAGSGARDWGDVANPPPDTQPQKGVFTRVPRGARGGFSRLLSWFLRAR